MFYNKSIGNDGLLIGITGGLAGWTVPLPATDIEKVESGDSRPSIESLYDSKESYMIKVKNATQNLIDERYVLEEDFQNIVDISEKKYDDFTK